MNNVIEERRSLSERLEPRVAVEQWMAKTKRRLRKKSILFRYERHTIRPLLKLSLQVCGLYGRGVKNALSPVVRRLELRFPHLPAAFDGYQVLHVSDLHIDGVEGLPEVLSRLLGELRPDVCLLTGDYRFEDHGPCERVYPPMRRVIQSIRAKDGIFGILGNHDISEIAYELSDMGVRMLINEAVELTRGRDSISLAGLDDDFSYQTDDLPGALASVPPDSFKILMAHSPELYAEAAEHGIDLYLCGHTHAGQLRFPVVGSLRNNARCPKEYTYGHWVHERMQGYTSSGVGCSSLPVRYNCQPEVLLIELRRGWSVRKPVADAHESARSPHTADAKTEFSGGPVPVACWLPLR